MNKSNRHIGNNAENLAVEYLQKEGYEILDRNYYSSHSEIDIVAKNQLYIVFFEVKMRSSTQFGQPFEQVTEAKVEHVFNAAEAWVIEHKLENSPMRFDVIGILIRKGEKPIINHIPDAYR